MFDRSYYKILSKSIKNRTHTIIHDNGIWLPSNYTVSKLANNLSLPLVISTHGMLQEWSITHKYFKKRIAWYFYQRNHFRSASLIHATSLNEAESIKKISHNLPVAIIPNGVNKPTSYNIKSTLDLRKFGSVPHSGFGMGLERMVAWVCGLSHIRETIPFARTMSRLNP